VKNAISKRVWRRMSTLGSKENQPDERSLWVNFVNYDFQIPGHAFAGLKNFSQVVFDPVARWSLALTVMRSAANVTIEFALGLGLALAMVRPFPGRSLVMSILIIPLFISPVIVGQAWALLLQRPFGPTNYLLGQLPHRAVTIGWLSESPWVYFALILSDVWQWTPFMFVTLLAGLTSIPPNLYEASEFDGIGGWLAFRLITPPLLAPMITLAITFRLLDAIRLFDTCSGGVCARRSQGDGPGRSQIRQAANEAQTASIPRNPLLAPSPRARCGRAMIIRRSGAPSRG